MDKNITPQGLAKALEALQNLAKSEGAVAHKDSAMTKESGATQLFHTPSNSDPGVFAGVRNDSVEGNGDVDVAPNGTDLVARAQISKSIYSKLSKNLPLSKAEMDFVAKGNLIPMKADKDKDDDMEKAEDHDDEEEDKKMLRDMVKPGAMKKSFAELKDEYPELAKGIDATDILRDLTDAISKGFDHSEQSIVNRVTSQLSKSFSKQADFQKSLAESLAAFSEVLTAHAQRIDQIESTPVRAPKSQQVAVMEKSFGGNEPISSANAASTLEEMVRKGLASSDDVVRVESTKQVSPDLQRRIQEFRSGR